MRRVFMLVVILLGSLTAAWAAAQDDPGSLPVPVTPPPETSITYAEIEQMAAQAAPSFEFGINPFALQAQPGSDHCSMATTINLSRTSPADGSVTDVSIMTTASDDPVLNCMWGTPGKGYRTVWFQFTPQYNGILSVSTLPASPQTPSYDTVLAVHTGACGDLVTVACNDDAIGFSSEVTFNVRRGTTYYIEVADWSPGGSSPQWLYFSAQIDPFTTFWQESAALVGGGTTALPRTRHTTVMLGSDMYLFGGRGPDGILLSDTWKYNTGNNQWTSLPSFPPALLNTTAVYLHDTGSIPATRRIYVPGGSAGVSGPNASLQHWYFDLDLGSWDQAPELVGGGALTQTFAYAAAAPSSSTTTPRYYVTGGVVGTGYPFTSTSTALDQVLIYTPSLPQGHRWDKAQPMISPRYGHTAARVGNRVCVAGGLNINQNTFPPALIPNGECANAATVSSWQATGNMNVPRYFAHSAVSPDGKWVVYGGVGANGLSVAEVEVYDPVTNQWSVLPLPYDLGGQALKPALVWPGGGFVGNYLWSLGGSFDVTGINLEPRVFKVQILGKNSYLPAIFNGTGLGNNHSLATAWRLPVNTTLSQNFTSSRIFYNTYYFDLAQMKTVNVNLTNVASDTILNLYVYDNNKLLRGVDDLPFEGWNKSVNLPNLPPGRYFVVVQQTFPVQVNPGNYYQIRVNQ